MYLYYNTPRWRRILYLDLFWNRYFTTYDTKSTILFILYASVMIIILIQITLYRETCTYLNYNTLNGVKNILATFFRYFRIHDIIFRKISRAFYFFTSLMIIHTYVNYRKTGGKNKLLFCNYFKNLWPTASLECSTLLYRLKRCVC